MSRMDKINELLRSELANLISRDFMVDGALATVTYVKCSPNLSQATIGVSVLPDKLTGTAVEQLRKQSSEFSGILRKKLRIKSIPRFNWVVDDRERHAAKLEDFINKMHDEEDNIQR